MTTSAKKMMEKERAEILNEFQRLRAEQQQLVLKMDQIQADLHDHKKVLEALATVNDERRCYRMIGEILCEQTVKDVKPILNTNIDNFTKLVDEIEKKISDKGTELNEYRQKHNIVIQK